MEEDLRQRISLLEQHVDWLYAQRGVPGPYGTPYGQPAPGGQSNSEEAMRRADEAWAANLAQPAAGSGGVSAAVQAYLHRGEPIRAIKQYRSETGVSLKEAKDAVDEAMRQLKGRG